MLNDYFDDFVQSGEKTKIAPAVLVATAAIVVTLVGGLVIGLFFTLLGIG